MLATALRRIGNATPAVPEWTQQASGVADDLVEVIFAAGLFVAIAGTNQRIITSPDGVTWTTRNSGVGGLFGIAFGAGTFVVTLGGASSDVLTSPDGITWTQQATTVLPAGAGRVAFGAGVFVTSVGNGDTYSSPDGLAWTLRLSAGAANHRVYFGQGKFVLTGPQPGLGPYTSPDGITWTSHGTANEGVLGYAEPIFPFATFLGGADNLNISINGVNVSGDILTGTGVGHFFTYGVATTPDGGFVVVGSGGVAAKSLNGFNWSNSVTGVFIDLNGVAFGAGVFVAVGNVGEIITRAPLNSGWQEQASSFANNTVFRGLAINQSGPVYVGVGLFGGSNTVVVSSDLASWTFVALAGGTYHEVVFANGLFVAASSAGDIASSPDGVTWNQQVLAGGALNGVAFSAALGLWVAVGAANRVYTSPDAITWTPRANPFTNGNIGAVAWDFSNNVFVAAGAGGQFMTSPDGITWTLGVGTIQNPAAANIAVEDIQFTTTAGFVAVGLNGVATSTDGGATWVGRLTYAGTLRWISFGNGSAGSIDTYYIAVGGLAGNEIIVSPDATNWFPRKSNISGSYALHAVDANNGDLFVAVGENTAGAQDARVAISTTAL